MLRLSSACLSSRSDKLIYVVCIPAVTYLSLFYTFHQLYLNVPLYKVLYVLSQSHLLPLSPHSRAVCPQLGAAEQTFSYSLTLDPDDTDKEENRGDT